MSWKEIIAEVARRSGASQAETTKVLDSFQEVVRERVVGGVAVRIPDLGTLDSSWHKGRSVRSIADMRKIVLDGRFVVTFRPAQPLKVAVADRTPQRWRDPRHQAAWRMAETLLGDLVLYHGARQPTALPQDPAEAGLALESAFGDAWAQARRAFESKVDPVVRAAGDQLVAAAIQRWS